ncbi:MAG: hypothetical protein ED557_13745 [Balneola sp.]|nr:MAG: hypothetical protein ED557_13745 [Balneola sp.]
MCTSVVTLIKYTVKTMNEQLLNAEPLISYPELALFILCVFGVLVYGAALRQEKKSSQWMDDK